MARERVYDWPGGRLRVENVLDTPFGEFREARGEWNVVPYGHGLALEQPWSIPLVDQAGTPLAELEVGIVRGRPAIVAIRALGDTALTTTFIRKIPGREMLDAFVPAHTVRLVRDGDEVVGELYVEAAPHLPPSAGGNLAREIDAEIAAELNAAGSERRRRILTEPFLREVAAVYRDAAAAGESTQKAIQEKWKTSASNARRWVWHARDRRLLGPAVGPWQAGELDQPKEEE